MWRAGVGCWWPATNFAGLSLPKDTEHTWLTGLQRFSLTTTSWQRFSLTGEDWSSHTLRDNGWS